MSHRTADQAELPPLDDNEKMRVHFCKNSFWEFVQEFWECVPGATPLVPNWHMEFVCDELQAIAERVFANLPNEYDLLFNLPPGTSKPVWEKMPVLMADGSYRKLRHVEVGDEVIGKSGRPCRVSAVHRQGKLACVKITTVGGREIITALDHPILTADGWVEAGDIVPDKMLALMHSPVIKGTTERGIDDFVLAGYLVGDGSVSSGNCHLTNKDPEYIDQFCQCADRMGFDYTVTKNKWGVSNIRLKERKTGDNPGRIGTNKGKGRGYRDPRGPRKWLIDVGLKGKTSKTKTIPSFVWRGSDDQIRAFLAAYFQCDGCVSYKTGEKRNISIAMCTISPRLAKGLQRLFLRLGISMRVRRRVAVNGFKYNRGLAGYVSYHIDTTDQDTASRFLEQIPIIGPKKRKLEGFCPRRRTFRQDYWPDRVVAVEMLEEPLPCRCLTVDGDESFVVEGVVVHNSTLCSILFQPWTWTRMPSARHIVATHTDSLALDLATKSRTVLQSEKYRRYFPDIELKHDQDTKAYYANTKGGDRVSCTVGGVSPIGRHSHFRSFDDPIDPQKALSEVELKKAGDFKSTILDTRVVDKEVSAFFGVMQRIHSDDPSGVLLVKSLLEGSKPCRHVCLPALIEGDSDNVSPPELRERYVDGLLDPRRMPRHVLQRFRVDMGVYSFSGQFMQTPVPLSGGLFKATYFLNRVRAAPYDCVRVRYTDRASTKEAGCYTASVLIAKDKEGIYYVEHVVRGQWEPIERNKILRSVALRDRAKYGKHAPVMAVEAEGGSSGRDAWLSIVRALDGFYVQEDRVTGSKETRAEPWSAQLAAGNVFMVDDGSYDLQAYITEHCLFPLGKYKDQVDACLIAGTQVDTSEGPKSIEDVREGDFVLTRQGYKRVLRAWCSARTDKLVSVLFSNGSVVTGTPDHWVWTENRGWIRLDACAGDDKMVITPDTGDATWESSGSSERCCPTRRPCGSRGCRTTGGPASGTSGEGGHTRPCTAPCGCPATGTSPLAMMSTTRTRTTITTISRILNASLRRLTDGSIGRPRGPRSIWRIWSEFAPSLRSGTARKRARSFIAAMGRRSGRTESRSPTSVSSATARSCPVATGAGRASSTVPPCATTAIAPSPGSGTTSRRSARLARRSSWEPGGWRPAPESVARDSDGIERVSVYDLMVEDAPEFFANGILVHNSTGAYNLLVNRRATGTVRVLGLSRVRKHRLTVAVCSADEEADALPLDRPHLTITVTEPGESGGGDCVVSFADIDPADYQDRWDAPVEGYDVPPADLLMTREHGKSIWKALLSRRDRPPEIVVVRDGGGGRARSIAYAITDALRLPRSAVYVAADPDDKGESEPPNRFVYDTVKSAKGMVVG